MPVSTTQRERLAQALGAASRRLAAQQEVEDVDRALQGVLQAAVVTVPGAATAGIGLLEHNTQLTTRACTRAVVRQYDQWHSDLEDGPCLESIRQQQPLLITDMRRERRWASFVSRALAQGLASLLTFPLYQRRRSLGVLSLYATGDRHFDHQARILGELFATHAAVALFGSVPKRQLDPALATRDLIGQAKGILMHREDITGMDAFSLLLRTSQETRTSLADVATWLVNEHEYPEQASYLTPR